MRLKCLFGQHRRSAGLAREYGRKMYSVCRHCGTPLVQGGDRVWRTLTPEQKIELDAARRAARAGED